MENNWVKVYETTDVIKAHMIIDMLEGHDIQAVEMNKKDSSYATFGQIEIYCSSEQASAARLLIYTINEK